MNDIIRKLAEQTFYYGNWEGDGIYTGQLDLEKFAKLIVRECADFVAAGEFGDSGTAEELKEHFGVKECWCESCKPNTMTDIRMILCQICGNKRCPHATNHIYECTNSNEPGQKGSSWENYKIGVK